MHTYPPEADRLLAELAADVRAGRISTRSAEYRRRWQRAAKGQPGAGTPRTARAGGYDGTPAPPSGTPLERAAHAIAAERGCTFTEAVVAALAWRGIATV